MVLFISRKNHKKGKTSIRGKPISKKLIKICGVRSVTKKRCSKGVDENNEFCVLNESTNRCNKSDKRTTYVRIHEEIMKKMNETYKLTSINLPYLERPADDWKKNSCYVNTTLWAVFHAHNNPFIMELSKAKSYPNLVQTLGKKPGCNNENVKSLLLDYYNKIQGDDTSLHWTTSNIRNFIQDCVYATPTKKIKYEKKFWTEKQQDNGEFFMVLTKLFNFKKENRKSIQQLIYSNPQLGTKIPKFTRKAEETENELPILTLYGDDYSAILNEQNGDITISYKSDDVGDARIDLDRNEQKELSIDDEMLFYKTITKKIIFTNANMFIILLNRTQWDDEDNKSTKPYSFRYEIGNLRLKSVVVHDGASSSSGHYTCYINDGTFWYLMNDFPKATITKCGESGHLPSKKLDYIKRNCTMLVYYPK
jgi:hypothetical protein